MTTTKTAKAMQLEFIGRIERDGSAIVPMSDNLYAFFERENPTFDLHTLSLSQGTYIAFNMNAYIVKLK